jgi:hypothetical protein
MSRLPSSGNAKDPKGKDGTCPRGRRLKIILKTRQIIKRSIESPRTPFYAWNDPRLVGRFFTFATDAIANDTPVDSECATPSVKAVPLRLQGLVTKSMGRDATATAYRLDLGKSTSAEGILVYRNGKLWNEDLGLDEGVQGSWLSLASTDRILLRWRDETIGLRIIKKLIHILAVQNPIPKPKARYAIQLSCQILIEAYRKHIGLLSLKIVQPATTPARSRSKSCQIPLNK